MIGGKLKERVWPIKTALRKGDVVRIISGREKGKEGKIIHLSRLKRAVCVERLNLIKKHTRPSQKYPQGGILEKEAYLPVSNVMIICGHCSRPVRLGAKCLPDGEKLRICRRCGEVLDKK